MRVEGDLMGMNVKNWRAITVKRSRWWRVVEEAETFLWLLRLEKKKSIILYRESE